MTGGDGVLNGLGIPEQYVARYGKETGAWSSASNIPDEVTHSVCHRSLGGNKHSKQGTLAKILIIHVVGAYKWRSLSMLICFLHLYIFFYLKS